LNFKSIWTYKIFKIITVSINKKSIEEARNYFSRATTELTNHFSALGSKCIELNAEKRLRIYMTFIE